MAYTTTGKHPQHEWKRLLQSVIDEVCGLPRPGLWLCVDAVDASGRPPSSIRIYATLHFLPEGSPFCCGEPECHLGLMQRIDEIGELVRRKAGSHEPVQVTIADGAIAVRYHRGVGFSNRERTSRREASS
jgi:hypothetical protein